MKVKKSVKVCGCFVVVLWELVWMWVCMCVGVVGLKWVSDPPISLHLI